jgi:membrane-associated protease RseP (regulator of RpoE activity)
MIFIAILIYVLGVLAPQWILKSKYFDLKETFSWKYSFFKLSGLLCSFLFAFILILILTLTNKDRFVLNKDAIYGLEFSETMKNYGFENGDKIVSINGQEVDRVSNIIKQIILTSGKTNIKTFRGENSIEIIIEDKEKLPIIQNSDLGHIKPIMQPFPISNNIFEQVKISEKRFGISNVFENYGNIWKYIMQLNPLQNKTYQNIGGFIAISKIQNGRGYFMLLAICSVFIGILSFLPLPGFSLGEFIISIFEKIRRDNINKRTLNLIRVISISLLIILISINIYM